MINFSDAAKAALFDISELVRFNPEFFATQYFPIIFIWASSL